MLGLFVRVMLLSDSFSGSPVLCRLPMHMKCGSETIGIDCQNRVNSGRLRRNALWLNSVEGGCDTGGGPWVTQHGVARPGD